MKTIINPVVVSRASEAESWAYAHAIADNKPAADRAPFFQKTSYDSDAVAWLGRKDSRNKQGLGLGGNIEVIGTPEQVVEQLAALKAAGIEGVQLSFYDFRADFGHFAQEILPLLKDAGLRL